LSGKHSIVDKRKRTASLLVVASLLLISGVSWFLSSGSNAEVEKVKQLQATAFSGKGPPSREKMDEMRRAMDQLTPAQRDEIMRPMREQMERRMEKRLDDYFALAPEQRAAYLDKEIKEMEKRHKEFESRRQQTGQGKNGPDSGPPPGGGPGPGPGGPGAPGGGPGGPGGRPPRPEEMGTDAAKQRRNDMFDHMSPSQRAKMDLFFSDMAKRRIAQGLPARPSPPGPPPGGPAPR
jgi:hypothetical protein